MDPSAVDPNQFIHVRMVLGMVVSLAIARLLSGFARFVQHPGRLKVYWIHMLWAAHVLIMLIHFWWWEFALSHIGPWHFGQFAFLIVYSATLYLLCAMLFPDDIAEYKGYGDYFMQRRRWFFGILALVVVLDVIDTWMKGLPHLRAQGLEYGLHTAVVLLLCAVAASTTQRRFHACFVGASLVYQASWIYRLYDVLA
jgi:hypothetical protein